jgi:hypothetical protein
MVNRVIYLLCSYVVILLINGCSSGKEIKKENTEKKIEVKKIENIDAVEREYIKENRIKDIEKVSFILDEKGDPVKGEKLSTVIYNPDGYETKTDIYNSKGQVEYVYNYDYKNNLRVKTTRYTPDGKADKYYTYTYNTFENKIKSTRYNLSNDMDKYYTYEYDDNGNLIKETWFDKSGNEEYKIEYEYDVRGEKTTAKTYNKDEDLIYTYKFKYDKKGNIIEEEKYDSDGDKTGIIQYIYRYY